MQKLRRPENRKVGYYAFIFKKLGRANMLDESFIYATTTEKNTLSSSKLGEFAIFNADLLKNYEKAEKYFRIAIEKEPQNSFWIGNYAIFLHYYKQNYKLAEKLYLRSLKFFKEDGFILYNYALLILFHKKDYHKTEILLKKAIKFEPDITKFQCTLAAFYFKIKKDFTEAEKICRKLNVRNNPQFKAVYAQLNLYKKDFKAAEILIDEAFITDPPDEIKLELWFYRFAHYEKWHEKAEYEINKLIKNGTKSLAWGLQKNVVIALFSGHPFPEKLEFFAKAIVGEFKI
ncbi:MAG: hypothetical protein JXR68_01550 [Bacteroidales bacterium]|nr:hypothetical protein [Bacteroidales bacterium]